MEAAETLPVGGELPGVVTDGCSMLQVFQIQQQQLIVIGDFEHHGQTPACVSFKSSMRESSERPMSEMVARTGWPFHRIHPTAWSVRLPSSAQAAPSPVNGFHFSLSPPACENPRSDRLSSAMKHGVPRSEKCWPKLVNSRFPVPVRRDQAMAVTHLG